MVDSYAILNEEQPERSNESAQIEKDLLDSLLDKHVCQACKDARTNEAVYLLINLSLCGAIPPSSTINTVASTLLRNQQPNHALEILETLHKYNTPIGLDIPAIRRLLRYFISTNLLPNANRLFQIINKQDKKLNLYLMMIESYIRVRDLDSARSVYDELSESGQKPHVVTFDSVVSGFMSKEKEHIVQEAFDEEVNGFNYKNTQDRNQIQSDLKACLESNPRIEQVEKFGESISQSEFYVAETVVLHYLTKHGGNVKTIVDRARKSVRDSKSSVDLERELLLDYLLELQNTSGSSFDTFDTTTDVSTDSKVDELPKQIQLLCVQKKINEAEDLLVIACKQGQVTSPVLFNSILKAYVDSKQCKMARNLYNRMEQEFGVEADTISNIILKNCP
jgi:pentatricopeptide repeat protein